MKKTLYLPQLFVILCLFIFSACSKSSNETVPYIDEIPGIYKGDLLIVEGESYDWISEALFEVTKTGHNKITVKPVSGKAYSNLPSCEFPVFFSDEDGGAVITLLSDPSGAFSYHVGEKVLGFSPFPKNGETIQYTFEGYKK